MPERLRWGVLGTANIALASVIPAIGKSAKNEVVAIASRDLERARGAAERLGIARAHGSYEALLADPEVEAVYIPLPNSLHRDWTVRAAAAGKHVLCEKPTALSVDDCRRMTEACRKAGVLFMEALMYRLHPQHARVRQVIESGLIGEPRLMRATFCFSAVGRDWSRNIRLARELGGGALMDVGVYAIDSCRFVLGAEPTEAVGLTRMDGVDLSAAAVLQFPGAVLAEISASFEAAAGGRYEVIGTAGMVAVDDAYAMGAGRPAVVRWRAGERTGEERFPPIDQYLLEVDAFADAVRGVAPSPIPDDAGTGNIAVIEQLLTQRR